MERIFHTPEGMRDIFGQECREKKHLQDKLHQVLKSYGYEDIETPALEYFEVFSSEVGTTPSKDLYKFFDREGHTLVLRPDITPSIARAASTHLAEQDNLRLCYTGNTYINDSSYRGSLKEVTQMGVERIGADSPEEDAEVLAMIAECMLCAGLTRFQISIGHVGFFQALLEESQMNEEISKKLCSLISNKNYFGVEELIKEQCLSPALEQVFLKFPGLLGSVEVLQAAKSLTQNPKALRAIRRLEEIYRILSCYGYEKYLSFDLGMLGRYNYYTGIICQAYTYGTGEPIVRGGRYDRLMEHFGRHSKAIGFVCLVDQLHLALSRQEIPINTGGKPQTIAYKSEDRREAIKKAKALRKQGRAVILMCIDGRGEDE